MQKSSLRIPAGLALVLLIGLIGFKDTGIFVNSFNAKLNSGLELNFGPNDRAEIVGEGASKTTYRVKLDGNDFYVPKELLLKVDNGIKGYTVVENTPLMDESGQVIRLLFLDEYLQVVEDRGSQVLVKSAEGIIGLVSKANIDPDRIRNIVEGIADEDINVNNGAQSLSLRRGDKVKVAWFEQDYYIVFDEQENKFNVPKTSISIYKKPETRPEVKEEPRAKTIAMPELGNQVFGSQASQIIAKAETLLGTPYVYGDTGKAGYDCSGLVYSLYGQFTDIKLPRSSRQMAEVGNYVTASELQPGDLLFFDSASSTTISHVALYIGDGMMIHASTTQKGVVKDSINGHYFQNNFVHARRFLD